MFRRSQLTTSSPKGTQVHPIRLGGRQTSSSEQRGRASAAGREDSPCSDSAGPDRTVIDSANGSPRADLGHRVASQPGRACVAARLAMTVQSGERGRSGLP